MYNWYYVVDVLRERSAIDAGPGVPFKNALTNSVPLCPGYIHEILPCFLPRRFLYYFSSKKNYFFG